MVYAILILPFGILVSSFVMLRAGFGTVTAYLGLVTGILGMISLTGRSVATIGNAIFAAAWLFALGYKLLRLAQD